ncbi:Pre-rRNA-processing protein TSR2-domain-containing protein [Zopfochytrium polystomum]|nr:Pre-rRNA-processing protein TSR2-domain-containing protein [Zopfochytrium polystomum]
MTSTTTAGVAVKALFAEGVGLVFSRWTALQLAVEHQMGGRASAEKAQTLQAHTVDFFAQHGAAVAPYELADNFAGFFEEEFNAQLEDGSPEQVAATLVALYREVAASASASAASGAATPPVPPMLTAMRAAAAAAGGAAASSSLKASTKVVEGASGEDDSDDDEDDYADGVDGVVDGDDGVDSGDSHSQMQGVDGAAEPRPPPVERIIDADGFELVQKGRRRWR